MLLCIIQVLNKQNTLSVSQSFKIIIIIIIIIKWQRKSEDTLTSSLPSMLNSLLWLGKDTIINACDPMQNLGQIQILYKLGQTHLTWIKLDPVDLDNADDPTRFQPYYSKPMYQLKYLLMLHHLGLVQYFCKRMPMTGSPLVFLQGLCL